MIWLENEMEELKIRDKVEINHQEQLGKSLYEGLDWNDDYWIYLTKI